MRLGPRKGREGFGLVEAAVEPPIDIDAVLKRFLDPRDDGSTLAPEDEAYLS